MAGHHYADQTAPARRWLSVTPSDSVDLPAGCRGLYVGTAGNLSLVGSDGTAITFATTDNNTIVPLAPTRVRSTGTTATGIVALY